MLINYLKQCNTLISHILWIQVGQEPLESPWRAPRESLESPWRAPGEPLLFSPCWGLGENLESPWRVPGEPLESPWRAPGEPLESPWRAPGEPLESPWRAPGEPLESPLYCLVPAELLERTLRGTGEPQIFLKSFKREAGEPQVNPWWFFTIILYFEQTYFLIWLYLVGSYMSTSMSLRPKRDLQFSHCVCDASLAAIKKSSYELDVPFCAQSLLVGGCWFESFC